MKAPRQWFDTWLKEDPKRFDLVDCFYERYHNPGQNAKTGNILTQK